MLSKVKNIAIVEEDIEKNKEEHIALVLEEVRDLDLNFDDEFTS